MSGDLLRRCSHREPRMSKSEFFDRTTLQLCFSDDAWSERAAHLLDKEYVLVWSATLPDRSV